MNSEMKKELIDWGVDWEEVKERFVGSEDLVVKFMIKYMDDPSFARLEAGLKAGDAAEAFLGAHALKGVAGNLALKGFLGDVRELTEILRPGKLDGTEEYFNRIRKKYDDLIAILSKYKGE